MSSKTIILNFELDSKTKGFKYSSFNSVSNLNFYTFEHQNDVINYNIDDMKKEIKNFLKYHHNEFEMLTISIYDSVDYNRKIIQSIRLVNRYGEKRIGKFDFVSNCYDFKNDINDYNLDVLISEYVNMYCLHSLKLVSIR